MSLITRLDALADLSVAVSGLTERELVRTLAFIRYLKRLRTGAGERALSGLVASLPFLELAAQTMDALDPIDTAVIVCRDVAEDQNDAEARALIGKAALSLEALRDAALTTDAADLDALVTSLRALADNEPPS